MFNNKELCMPKKNLVLFTITATLLMAFVLTPVASPQDDDRPPSSTQIAFAQKVSDLMLNELLAALFKEFDETTPQNVDHGKQAISLIFNDLNRDMRLVGKFRPLLGKDNDRPNDGFETTALNLALTGQPYTAVQQVNDTWFYRRSIPLSNTFHQNCVLCHTNFTPAFFNSTNNPGQWVGTLVLRVPIKTEDN
jgi:hypothetical protein